MPSSLFSNQQNVNQSTQNPINNLAGQMGQIKQMYNQLNGTTNPAQLMSQLAMSNPTLNQTISQINNQYGGDAKAAFFDQASKKGVDPNSITNAMKQFGF